MPGSHSSVSIPFRIPTNRSPLAASSSCESEAALEREGLAGVGRAHGDRPRRRAGSPRRADCTRARPGRPRPWYGNPSSHPVFDQPWYPRVWIVSTVGGRCSRKASVAAVCQSLRCRTSGPDRRTIAATAAEKAKKRRSLSGKPSPSGCRYGWARRVPHASTSVIGPTPSSMPRRARAGPAHSGTSRSSTVSSPRAVAEVVGHDHLDVDTGSPESLHESRRGGGEAADTGERGEFGGGEQHAHARKYGEPDERRRRLPSPG